MSNDKQMHLLDNLQSLLEKQIKLAQQGNISDVEALSRQAGSLVGKIVQTGIFEMAEFENRRKQFQKLYKDLRLAITAQKADSAEKLNRVRRGKKTIKTYRSNI